MPLAALLAHPDVARLARVLRETPGTPQAEEPNYKWAAIAVTIRMGPREPELLLIKRAEHQGDPWSGHVACPGGRQEPEDASLEVTAIRETREETAIDLAKHGRALGTLDDLSPRTPYLPPIIIRPFVFACESGVSIQPSVEVADFFWAPLSEVRDTGAWGTSDVRVRGVLRPERTFTFRGHVVWGLTERVLRQLTQRIGPAPG